MTTISKGLLKTLSSWQISSVNKIILYGLLIFFLHPAISHIFHGPGILGSRFFKVPVFEDPGQGLGPGFRSSLEMEHWEKMHDKSIVDQDLKQRIKITTL